MSLPKHLKQYCPIILSVLACLIAFLLIYSPTLFSFFIGDDFAFISWASQAVNTPKMLFEQYFSTHAWGTAVFYRPMLFTVLFLGYKFWGNNALYFRLLNIVIELLNALMLGLLVFILNRKPNDEKLAAKPVMFWSLFSAALFILSPLHSECINWITVLINPLIALFLLLSLCCYIQWRAGSNKKYFVLSILSAIFAFLTKEMAVILPPTLFAYELLFLKGNSTVPTIDLSDRIRKELLVLHSCMLQTFPYWLILVLYFCLRKIILDDFIGGYPDNLCHQSIGGWYHGIVNIFVPINSAVFDNHGLISVIFQTFLFILIVMTIMATFRTEGNKKRIILFSIIWFLLTLIPNYKIFPSYMNSGVGSRLAYLSTLPLSIFLTFGLSKFSSTKNLSRIIQLFAIAVFFLFGMLLYANNIIWAEAGHWTNKVVSELQQLKTSGDPLVYVAGLPDCSKYGIPCIGALQWLTAKPILDRNLVNCLRVEDEHYISADSIKEAVRKNRPGLTPLYWNSQTSKLEPVLTHIDDRLTKKWQGDNLRRLTHIFFIPVNTRHSTDWANDGTLTLTSDCKGNGFITLCFETVNIPCLDVDFFALKIKSPFFKSNSHLNASLLFTNNIIKDHCNCSDMAYASIKPTAEEQEIIFSLKNMSKWSMGGKCTQIKIVLPAVQSISIKGLRIPETRDLVPSVYFHEFDYDRPGQLRFGSKGLDTQFIKYDAHSIIGTQKVILEATQVATVVDGVVEPQKINSLFVLKKQSSNVRGTFKIEKKEFPPEPAIYRAQIRALDEIDNQAGFPSSIFFLRTDY